MNSGEKMDILKRGSNEKERQRHERGVGWKQKLNYKHEFKWNNKNSLCFEFLVLFQL